MKISKANKIIINNSKECIKELISLYMDAYEKSYLTAISEFKEVDWMVSDDDWKQFALLAFAMCVRNKAQDYIDSQRAVIKTKDILKGL